MQQALSDDTSDPRGLLPLPRDFFERDALVVARALVGTRLVVTHTPDASPRVARIVETEAYRGPKDLACHARVGLTKRTRTLYGPPGRAYVFLIYGMYDCFNVVSFAEGKGHAVLVRAVEPVSGIRGGITHGASDEWSYRAVEHPTYGYDLHATVLHLLGIDHTKLTFRHNGIDRRLTDVHGHVIQEILA